MLDTLEQAWLQSDLAVVHRALEARIEDIAAACRLPLDSVEQKEVVVVAAQGCLEEKELVE